MRRRQVLAAVPLAASGLAGCLTAGAPTCDPAEPPPDGFEIINRDDVEHTLTVEVIREFLVYSETIFEETYTLGTSTGGGNFVRVPGVVDWAGHHIIRGELDNGEEATYLWQVTPDQCDPTSIVVDSAGRLFIDRPGEIPRGGPSGPGG